MLGILITVLSPTYPIIQATSLSFIQYFQSPLIHSSNDFAVNCKLLFISSVNTDILENTPSIIPLKFPPSLFTFIILFFSLADTFITFSGTHDSIIDALIESANIFLNILYIYYLLIYSAL